MIHVDLFSGYGGFALAAHAVGIRTIAFCEIEPYPQRILARHFPGVPVFPDVKELDADALANTAGVQRRAGAEVSGSVSQRESDGGELRDTDGPSEARQVRGGCDALADATGVRLQGDGAQQGTAGAVGRRMRESARGDSRLLITAGFPCQDLSYAGQGAGLDGERSGLYREVVRLVRELRPGWVLLENVPAILTRGVGRVVADLAASGYGWAYGCVPACAVGAPHRRDRWWCVAWPTLGDAEDKARGTRIWAAVLAGLTPWGSEMWHSPRAEGFDAGGGDAHSSLPQQAKRETWPTPTSRDHKDGSPCDVPVNALLGRAVWPTPRSREGNAGSAGSAGSIHNAERNYLDGVVQEGTVAPVGSLNPDWTETLMGLPIGYTRTDGDPDTTLPCVWPVGHAEDGDWPTPRAGNPGSRRPGTGGKVIAEEARKSHRWPTGLGMEQHDWEPPRLTTEKADRANRLKAIGNGIVPQVAALWLHAIADEDTSSGEEG